MHWHDRQTISTPDGEFLSISAALSKDAPRWLHAHAHALIYGRDKVPLFDTAPYIPPGKELKLYQQETVTTMVSGFDTLAWDEPGLGKTISAIVAANILTPRRVLIVCPSAVKYNWDVEWKRWSMLGFTQSRILEGETKIEIPVETQIVFINYDILKAHLSALLHWRPELIVWDESHRLKSQTSQRTLAMNKLKVVATHNFFLSGTPLDRPIDLYPILKVLLFSYPSASCADLRDHMVYSKQYCAGFVDRSIFPYKWNDRGASNVEELRRRLRQQVMVSHPSSVLGLVPLTESMIVLPPPDDIDTVEDQLLKMFFKGEKTAPFTPAERKEYMQHLTDRILDDPEVVKTFEELATYRRICGIAKVDAAAEVIRNMLVEDPGPIVIYAYHKEVVTALAKKLPGSKTITGDDTAKSKAYKVAEFQLGNFNILIANLTSAGEGVTLTAANRMVIVELDYNATTIRQVKFRIQRRGQTRPCHLTYILADRTIDTMLVRRVMDKAATLDALMVDSPP